MDSVTGKVLWRNDSLKVDYETNAGSSPVLYKNCVILPCDGADAQFVVALDAATGEVAPKTERPAAAKRPWANEQALDLPNTAYRSGRSSAVRLQLRPGYGQRVAG
ncbi:MAG: hypothetical protein U0792_21375 [Gemmataceae bacterium]